MTKPGNPLVEDSFGQTPLHLAVVHTPQDPERIKQGMRALLNRDTPLNLQDGNGQTPLHMAAQIGNHWAVELILEHYIFDREPDEDDEADEDSETDVTDLAALIYQAALIRRAEDLGIRDNDGSTPFHLAAMLRPSNYAKILDLLNEAGGRCTCKTPNGDSSCESLREKFKN
ncbi:hypothetical protein N7466_006388 [Penicillium verhagenii]|uniref:uncharacterized protein n=1 Tax=Penicillium verhagenii TaxID=1562060 RepID=UPI0025450A1B|nr:uncharacterized protein N7466_006388 [Penicillium verhagenii]KAJ5930895.1 hypothetical protein N7466_006388 [Penicillium verhagenii]